MERETKSSKSSTFASVVSMFVNINANGVSLSEDNTQTLLVPDFTVSKNEFN